MDPKNIPVSCDVSILQKLVLEGGMDKVAEYVDRMTNQWKTEKVKIAITGRPATGKSTFINKMRGVGPEDDGFAKSGSGNTTLVPTEYVHPKNKNIIYCDLPGVGTLEFKKDEYVKDMTLPEYDYFLIFVDKVLLEDDLWLVRELKKLCKPFSLVRSKIDLDIKNAAHDGKSKEEIIPQIRETLLKSLKSEPDLQLCCNIFLISGKQSDLGDMPDLLNHMEKYLPSTKFEAVLHSLPCLNEFFIELVYKNLKKRIYWVCTKVFFASQIPLIRIDINNLIFNETVHYVTAFSLSLIECKSITQQVTMITKGTDLNEIINKWIKQIMEGVHNKEKSPILEYMENAFAALTKSVSDLHCVDHALLQILDTVKNEALSVVRKNQEKWRDL